MAKRRWSAKTVPMGDLMATESHWNWDTCVNQLDDVWGFVYRITRLSDGKDYLGSKCVTTKSSPWPTYVSSSKILAAEIKEKGISSFQFDILVVTGDRNSTVMAEACLQILEDVIHRDNNYNRAISCQRWIGKTKHTAPAAEILADISKGHYLGESYPEFSGSLFIGPEKHSEKSKQKMSEARLVPQDPKGSRGQIAKAHQKALVSLESLERLPQVIIGVSQKNEDTVSFRDAQELADAGFNLTKIKQSIAGHRVKRDGTQVPVKSHKGYQWALRTELEE